MNTKIISIIALVLGIIALFIAALSFFNSDRIGTFTLNSRSGITTPTTTPATTTANETYSLELKTKAGVTLATLKVSPIVNSGTTTKNIVAWQVRDGWTYNKDAIKSLNFFDDWSADFALLGLLNNPATILDAANATLLDQLRSSYNNRLSPQIDLAAFQDQARVAATKYSQQHGIDQTFTTNFSVYSANLLNGQATKDDLTFRLILFFTLEQTF